jgi:hypothetical protein
MLLGCDDSIFRKAFTPGPPKTRKRGKTATIIKMYIAQTPPSTPSSGMRGIPQDLRMSPASTPRRIYEVPGTEDGNGPMLSKKDAHVHPSASLEPDLARAPSIVFPSTSRLRPLSQSSPAAGAFHQQSGSWKEPSPLKAHKDSPSKPNGGHRGNAFFSASMGDLQTLREQRPDTNIPTPATVLSAASTPHAHFHKSVSHSNFNTIHVTVEGSPQAICSPRAPPTPRTVYAAAVLSQSAKKPGDHECLDSLSIKHLVVDGQGSGPCSESKLYGSAASNKSSLNGSGPNQLVFKRTIADMPMSRWAPERRDLFLGAIATLADVPMGSVRILEVNACACRNMQKMSLWEYMCVSACLWKCMCVPVGI